MNIFSTEMFFMKFNMQSVGTTKASGYIVSDLSGHIFNMHVR